MKIAALHLEGKAIQWHQGFMRVKSDQQVTWEEYIEYMGARFGTHAYRDPLSDLRNSKQVGSLQDYLDSFDELYLCAKIREDQTLSSFLSGLIDVIRMPVRMFRPKSLAEAYSLAKLQELTVAALKEQPTPATKTPTAGTFHRAQNHHQTITTTTNTQTTKHPSQTGLLPTPKSPKFQPNHFPRNNKKLSNRDLDENRAKGALFTVQ